MSAGSPNVKEIARQRARELLEEFRVTSAPVPIEKIIKKRDIVLQYAPFEEDLSGMAYINDGLSIIGINALHHPNRQRFSAAHELGHHVLHAEHLKNAVHVDKGLRVLLRDDVSSQGVDLLEIEANAFASELLMPKDLLVKALDEGGVDMDDDTQIETLAKKFRVSASALRFRLIGLMNDPQTK
ncbi:MAG TPA: ImmA/IrrE family metallo-endopeptidase [Xanthomonadaceae bacterium]|jgi:Zn-dependent peptidase ImmA (M78 family)|uniref:ImmA/IrrE family metallo-endopeptidase n=1 Tax=Lysobacter hankyongensis TaxID=1176535 RepID=A0ABP9BL88_9GAMM